MIDNCPGCKKKIVEDNPSTEETVLDPIQQSSDYRCYTCGTVVSSGEDNDEEQVDCRNCGEQIPKSEQGKHDCEGEAMEDINIRLPNSL